MSLHYFRRQLQRMPMCKKLLFIFQVIFLGAAFQAINAQANIQVRVISVAVNNNVDCDGFVSGDSDFAFEYAATDNTLGLINNSPAAFGLTGDFNFSFKNNDNGPWSLNVNEVFFNHDYQCPEDVPDTIVFSWQGYENDAPIVNWDLLGNLSELRTNPQIQNILTPLTTGTTGPQTFTATGTSGCGTQSYTITIEVIRTDLNFSIMQDNICNALLITADDQINNYAFCGTYTTEPGEPMFASSGNAGHGTAWFYFTLPANSSGNIRVSTDLPETNFGTEIALYHAADGIGCLQGTNNFSNLQIKNKFNYLSEHSFADDDIPVIAPQGKAVGNWNGGLISEGDPLIPGETYYLQFTTDAPNQKGSVGIRITDLGGTPSSFNDIPCTSPTIPDVTPTTVVSSELTNANSPTLTLNYSRATDREAGAPFTSTNAEDYVAYLYEPSASTSNTITDNVWFNFQAPLSGRLYFEGEITGLLNISEAEDIALYGLDSAFAPGRPQDLFCSNLRQLAAASGSISGSSRTAKIMATCLEPGYTYYGTLDPQTVSSVSTGKVWLYDPSEADPINNAPGNDILCLAMQDTLFEVPVILDGLNPTFQAVAGTNKYACREYLAGEPSVHPDPSQRADQTVWHYFTAPASGSITMSIRAYIGMNNLRYNIYELFNGTDCYGGLGGRTYTNDGTQSTGLISPIISGTAGFNGAQQSACCLVPGKKYAIQIDGASPTDIGQYIIEYIREVKSDAGDIFAVLDNGDSVKVTVPTDTAFVCFGENLTPGILLNGIGQSTADLPLCVLPGYLLHSSSVIPTTLTQVSIIDSIQSLNAVFTNNTSGDGSFGNPLFNTVYFLSPAADLPASWGTFSCGSATIEQGIPVVFLRPLDIQSSYNNDLCRATFSATGGLSGYNNQPYNYTITSPLGAVVQSGTLQPNTPLNYVGSIQGIYTVVISDGHCDQTFTFDASNCGDPCEPATYNVTRTICQGESAFLGGQNQTVSGVYTDIFVTPQGCDSTVNTTLFVTPAISVISEVNICSGGSITVAGNVYTEQGIYVDTLQNISGCDSVVTTVVFVNPIDKFNAQITICEGETYQLGTQALTTSGLYEEVLTATDGCDSLVILVLTVNDCSIVFEISNILTPNDDGQNDTWRVSDPSQIAGCDVAIFNRWGQPVYKTNDYQNEWAGTKNGEPLPDGVYFYAIKCSDKEYTGSINLLRFKK